LDDLGLCWLIGDSPVGGRAASGAEFAAVFDFAVHAWQLSPTLVTRVSQWAADEGDADGLARLQSLAVATSALGAVQMTLCRRVAAALDQEEIPYCLLKGSAVRVTAYPDPAARCGLDVDIAVPAPYLAAAEQVIAAHGFYPASLVDGGRHFRLVDPEERAAVESTHYELACQVRRQRVRDVPATVRAAVEQWMDVLKPWHLDGGDLGCYVTLDVHHGLSLDIPVDEVVERATIVTVPGGRLRVPPVSWMLFHLIFKIYWEGAHNYRKGVYQYADLVRLLRVADDKAVAELLDLLERYVLQAAGHYVLRRLPDEFETPLPPPLTKFVAAARTAPTDVFPNEVNDVGDMWPKLWGHR
jgi:hypothetical protein